MWCWRRLKEIIWTDNVRNEEVFNRVKEERNILHTITREKANWIGHILRRNFIYLVQKWGKLAGFCKHDNKPSLPIMFYIFLDQLRSHYLWKIDSNARN
jgi:hypothetical protein